MVEQYSDSLSHSNNVPRRSYREDFIRRMKGIPQVNDSCKIPTSKEAEGSLKAGLVHNMELYRQALPPYIFAEHCTGENKLQDAVSLGLAYNLYLNRKK